MRNVRPVVLILDDHASVRTALAGLFRSVGLDTMLFASPTEFMARTVPDQPGCLILDIRLPSVNGLDFHTKLLDGFFALPVIFITGHGDIPMSVQAMKAGAIDFLTKPVRDQDLLDVVHAAIAKDLARRGNDDGSAARRLLYGSLTLREREVLEHVYAGLMNKQIAGILNLSEVTVKVHRSRLMQKMQTRTLAELIRSVQELKEGGAADPTS